MMKSILLAMLIAVPAHAELSDAELLKAASAELSVPEEAQMEGSGATVLTADSIPDLGEELSVAPRDVSLGIQDYQTSGTSSISPTETYALGGLKNKPMTTLTISKWFSSLSRVHSGARWGATLGFGFARSNMNLISSSGSNYDNVSVTSFLPSVGPAAEYYWPVGAGFALGATVGYGRQFLVQSNVAPSANKTLQADFLEGGPYARIYFSENIFARIAYIRRSIIGSSDLGIQPSNTLLSFGFGI